MKMNSKILGIFIMVFLFGGIALSSMLGYWNTEGNGGRSVDSQLGEQDISASDNAESEIRGRTTFQELLDLGLSQEVIENIINGPMPDPQTRVKDYCLAQGLSFETIKSALKDELDKQE